MFRLFEELNFCFYFEGRALKFGCRVLQLKFGGRDAILTLVEEVEIYQKWTEKSRTLFCWFERVHIAKIWMGKSKHTKICSRKSKHTKIWSNQTNF